MPDLFEYNRWVMASAETSVKEYTQQWSDEHHLAIPQELTTFLETTVPPEARTPAVIGIIFHVAQTRDLAPLSMSLRSSDTLGNWKEFIRYVGTYLVWDGFNEGDRYNRLVMNMIFWRGRTREKEFVLQRTPGIVETNAYRQLVQEEVIRENDGRFRLNDDVYRVFKTAVEAEMDNHLGGDGKTIYLWGLTDNGLK
jgi:hypothetical protein